MQPGILAPVLPAGRYVVLDAPPDLDPRALVERLAAIPIGDGLVLGIGAPLVMALDTGASARLPGLRVFPALAGPACAVPSTQGAVFVHARGDDHGETLLATQRVLAALGGGLRIAEDVVGFRFLEGRDLTGYEDGTENPKADAAERAAIVAGAGPGLDGGSFVAAQRWVHDLGGFERLAPAARDRVIGRSRATNEELADAPPSAHVKRAAQESFDPAAFMVRRSMPYGTVTEHGLYFVAYGASLAPFEAVLARMIGREDGIVDGLFQFSRPVSGGYYWCPPIDPARDRLDLRALTGRA